MTAETPNRHKGKSEETYNVFLSPCDEFHNERTRSSDSGSGALRLYSVEHHNDWVCHAFFVNMSSYLQAYRGWSLCDKHSSFSLFRS